MLRYRQKSAASPVEQPKEIVVKLGAVLLSSIALSTLLLTGCASFTYGGQKYSSSQAALEAARQDVRRAVSTVPRRESVAAGSILIYTPSTTWSRQGVAVTGAAGAEAVNYVALVLYYGYHGMAESVDRRNLFSSVDIREFDQRDPLANPKYDYLLWLRLDGPNSAQWMISSGKDTSAPTAVYTSPISDSTDRISHFVESIEKYLVTFGK
jgi:hypothetical protein